MQTFMPLASFQESIAVLDNKRLGKQRVEALQILDTLINKKKSWSNHPATLQWKNNIPALAYYGILCCQRWISLGFKDTCTEKILNLLKIANIDIHEKFEMPSFMGNDRYHSSHRSNLLKKDFKHYSKYSWNEPDNLEYYWPSKG